MLQDAVRIKLFTGIKELEEFTEKKSTESRCKKVYQLWLMKSWCHRSLGAEKLPEGLLHV